MIGESSNRIGQNINLQNLGMQGNFVRSKANVIILKKHLNKVNITEIKS